jgi:hypothetical protein
VVAMSVEEEEGCWKRGDRGKVKCRVVHCSFFTGKASECEDRPQSLVRSPQSAERLLSRTKKCSGQSLHPPSGEDALRPRMVQDDRTVAVHASTACPSRRSCPHPPLQSPRNVAPCRSLGEGTYRVLPASAHPLSSRNSQIADARHPHHDPATQLCAR